MNLRSNTCDGYVVAPDTISCRHANPIHPSLTSFSFLGPIHPNHSSLYIVIYIILLIQVVPVNIDTHHNLSINETLLESSNQRVLTI